MAFDLAVTNFRQVKVGVSHQKIIVTCCHVEWLSLVVNLKTCVRNLKIVFQFGLNVFKLF